MSNMKLRQEDGFISGILIALIATSVLLLGTLGFAGWAFMSRQDYKFRSDEKSDEAVAVAVKKTEADDAVKYAEAAKNPLVIHKGPSEFGAISVKYPKTWSGYVIESKKNSTPVEDYFHPRVVSDTSNKANAYALRIQVVDKSYDSVIKTYESAVKTKKLSARPYSLPMVKDVIGTRFDGQVELNKQGQLIVLPMRNMTLKIWTEAPSFMADFTKIILPNITFSP
jgi:hypothetical protein